MMCFVMVTQDIVPICIRDNCCPQLSFDGYQLSCRFCKRNARDIIGSDKANELVKSFQKTVHGN